MDLNIFEFWSLIPRDAYVHPEDEKVFNRSEHHFRPDCLPCAFYGPLKSAPVVLLFLSPGFEEFDIDHCRLESGRAFYERQRTGTACLPTKAEHPDLHSWCARILRQFDVQEERARTSVAFLNMAPYKSRTFEDWHMLSALPSSRVAVTWAQKVLFPQAEAGTRLVICLRSAKSWGLRQNAPGPFGKALYAPPQTRSGFMCHGLLRERIVEEVQRRISG